MCVFYTRDPVEANIQPVISFFQYYCSRGGGGLSIIPAGVRSIEGKGRAEYNLPILGARCAEVLLPRRGVPG